MIPDDRAHLHMTAQAKDISLKLILACCAMVFISYVLLIPGILVYKLAYGAPWLNCLAILAAYATSWVGTGFLLVSFKKRDTFRKRDVVCVTFFAVCFFALLYWSLRL